MGFLSKLKSVANMVTGGGANVALGYENGSVSVPFKVNVLIEVKDIDIEANGIYLNYNANEELLQKKMDEESGEVSEEWEYESDYHKEIKVSGPQILKSGEKYNFEIDVDITDSELVTFEGEKRRVKCTLLGGIDCKGNDPDSGFKTINVTI